MGNLSIKSRHLVTAVIFSISVLFGLFQSCEPPATQPKIDAQSLAERHASGNGESYDGLRELNSYAYGFISDDTVHPLFQDFPFYRYTSFPECPSQSVDHKGLLYSDDVGGLFFLSSSCETDPISASLSQLVLINFMPDYLIYNQQLFKRSSNASILNSVFERPETLCRAQINNGQSVGVVVSRTQVDGGQVGNTPASKIFDFTTGTLDPIFIFTRGSVATYFDEQRVLQYAGSSDPRFEFDSETGENMGMKFEFRSTNLLLNSAEINSNFNKARSSVLSNQGVAPDGQSTADVIVGQEFGRSNYIYQNISKEASRKTYTFSAFLKPKELNSVAFWTTGVQAINKALIEVDLSVGEITKTREFGEFKYLGSRVQKLKDDWVRVSLSFETNAETTLRSWILLMKDDGHDAIPVGTEGVYVWGAQLEERPFPTSYIPTQGSSVTRERDFLRSDDLSWFAGPNMPSTFVVDWQNFDYMNTPNAFYMNADRNWDHAVSVHVSTCCKNATTARVMINGDSTSNTSLYSHTWEYGDRRLTGITFDGDQFTAFENGQHMGTKFGLPTPPSFNFISIGSGPNSGNIHGYIKSLKYWNSMLSLAELKNRTEFVSTSLSARIYLGIPKGDGLQSRQVANFAINRNEESQSYGSEEFNFQLQMESLSATESDGQFTALIDGQLIQAELQCLTDPDQ